MADIKNKRDINAYVALCDALDERNWTYEKVEDELLVHFTLNGDDLPMQFLIFIDSDRQLVRLLSPMTSEMSEEKRMDGAIAVCHASYVLSEGSFDYDLSNGRITYRMTYAFLDNEVNTEVILYLVDFAGAVVDRYNDKFLALNKGYITLEKFLEE